MIFLGIDPGLNGAFAWYDTAARSISITDMPIVEVMRNGKKKREVSAALVAHAISEHTFGANVALACLERVNAMAGQGVTSVFSFGRSSGILEGVLAAFGIPTILTPPQTWIKATNVRGGKDGSRERAMQLFPDQAGLFARKKDDGRSDAALMAYYASTIGPNK